MDDRITIRFPTDAVIEKLRSCIPDNQASSSAVYESFIEDLADGIKDEMTKANDDYCVIESED